jgi:hypothetical protein
MSRFTLSDGQAAAFEADGYLMVKSLLSAEENDLLSRIARADHKLAQQAWTRHDLQGAVTRISLRNDLPDDTYSAVVRSRRIVDSMERMLGGEVYHYHHKMTMKEPHTGGAWEWHQDYGYWYNNGCLLPYMASCYIAVDRATRENGCMQVIRGSHHMGRIEHGVVADQTGADLERVEKALERMELVYCEMEPGDGLFFHCNLLHRSDQNRSDTPRWGFICCYNAARNDPYKVIPGGHPNYSPLEKWDDARVKEYGDREWAAMREGDTVAA